MKEVERIIGITSAINSGDCLPEAADLKTQKQKLIDEGWTESGADLADALLDLYFVARIKGTVELSSNAFAKAHNVLLNYGLLDATR